MDEFVARLNACAQAVEAALGQVLAELESEDRVPARLLAAMRHGSLGGGKRLRPFLLQETAQLFGVSREASLFAALAVEAVHCYSLIHDDLPAMDDDDLRRGRPTVHKAFDDATAILAGDALLTHAFGLLADPRCHSDAGVRISLVGELVLGSGAGGMVGGQMRDIEGETTPLDANGISRMQAMKTGALIRASVRMGAVVGGAPDAEFAALTQYAEAAGRAFQLADDLLDVTATSARLGKATGKDAAKNKQTLVAQIGVEGARRQLTQIVGEAIEVLSPFGPRAEVLRQTALYFAARET